MAETIHLFLKANGMDIRGESTQTSLGRNDSIECYTFEHSVRIAAQAGSGMATGRRQYEPVVIRKSIDKASPLLMKALCNNEVIDCKFLFFRPNPTGDGTTEQFYTVRLKNARISSIRQFVPDVLQAGAAKLPPLEEVAFTFSNIIWLYNNGGVTHEDSIGRGR